MAKCETNAERRAREYQHRTTLQMATYVAEWIRKRRENKADLAPRDMDLPAKKLKEMGWHPESKRWWQNYAFLGQVFCEFCPFDENPAKLLRLVADALEGKPQPYNKSDLSCDGAITKAYIEAGRRSGAPFRLPSFSEFQKIFSKQPPLPSDRRNIKPNRPQSVRCEGP
jgi:hypothetical protein